MLPTKRHADSIRLMLDVRFPHSVICEALQTQKICNAQDKSF